MGSATDDLLTLLTFVLPAFLRLAEFYTSNDKAAIAARAELDSREPFFTQLHDELRTLDHSMPTWTADYLISERSLRRILDLFESRFVKVQPVRLSMKRRS